MKIPPPRKVKEPVLEDFLAIHLKRTLSKNINVNCFSVSCVFLASKQIIRC